VSGGGSESATVAALSTTVQGSWSTCPPSSPHLISPPACHSNGLLQLLTAMPQLHGLHCSRHFGKPASVNNWSLCDAYPGANFTARERVAQRVLGRPVTPLTALWINNPTIDTDHRHRGCMLTKTPPPTELQIPATVTTLVLTQYRRVTDGRTDRQTELPLQRLQCENCGTL